MTTIHPAPELHHEIHGHGRPLVLLHAGLLTAERTFGALLPGLVADHQVILVELQGHGHTPDVDRDPTLPALAGDVVALLDGLGISRADVIGVSLGGLVALELAVTHPDRVDRLVLASAHIRPDGYHHEILDPATHTDSRRMPSADDFATMVADYRAVAPDPDHFEVIAGKLQAVLGAFVGWSPEALAGVVAPTLLMIGDTDFVRIEHAAEMLEALPDARLAVLPGTTHGSLTTRTALVLPMLAEFLGR